MAVTPHDSSGTALSFGGTNFTVTSITYTLGSTGGGGTDAIDISHLGQTTGASVLSQPRPLIGSAGTTDTGKTVSIEYIGNVPIAQNATGTLTITGGVSVSASATCNSSSVTLTVNDVVRGTADFSLA